MPEACGEAVGEGGEETEAEAEELSEGSSPEAVGAGDLLLFPVAVGSEDALLGALALLSAVAVPVGVGEGVRRVVLEEDPRCALEEGEREERGEAVGGAESEGVGVGVGQEVAVLLGDWVPPPVAVEVGEA